MSTAQWTPEEDAVLRKNLHLKPTDLQNVLAKVSPTKRSVAAIKTRRSRIGRTSEPEQAEKPAKPASKPAQEEPQVAGGLLGREDIAEMLGRSLGYVAWSINGNNSVPMGKKLASLKKHEKIVSRKAVYPEKVVRKALAEWL